MSRGGPSLPLLSVHIFQYTTSGGRSPEVLALPFGVAPQRQALGFRLREAGSVTRFLAKQLRSCRDLVHLLARRLVEGPRDVVAGLAERRRGECLLVSVLVIHQSMSCRPQLFRWASSIASYSSGDIASTAFLAAAIRSASNASLGPVTSTRRVWDFG